MTYSIIKIDLEDFRSFKGKHSFTFPTEPGLYGLTGENKANPELGPNGIGKTSLLEAIHWCDYGCTTRGLKAGDIINYDAKSCSVTVEHHIAGETLIVARTQSPNSLRLNGTIVDQQTLEKHLRIGPAAFTYAVMFPQFGDAFFDRSPSEKLALFSQIMELDYWLEKSKAADDLAKELNAEKLIIEQSAARLQGSLDTFKGDIAGLIIKRDAFEAEKRTKIAEQEQIIKSLKKDLIFYGERSNTIDMTLQELRQRLQKAQQRAADHAALKRLNGLSAICPTCLQEVDAKHLQTEKSRLEKAVGSKEANPKRDLQAIETNIHDFEGEKHGLERKQIRDEEALNQVAQSLKQEREQANPYDGMIEAKKEQRLKLQASLNETKGAIKQVEQDHAAVSYWVGGFKRIRLFIIEQALQQLELEINNALGSLGLLEWRVELDVERENKSGGITKGFTVLVFPPSISKPIKFEAYSGGEVQRLRLAGNLGLANLIMERAGLRSAIEFYDEPSSHLSDEGTLDLADTLMQRAIETERCVIMVEHRLPDYPYTSIIKLVKTGAGSHIA